ncbi:hypothetical protein ACOSQ4_022615 [Xanthoceras sorbifolium]
MSFEVGPSKSPSALSSSSSSSAILNVYANNYLPIAYYLNQEDNDQPCHRGSIPGYKVIHRRREEAKHNLWDDYFTKNPQYNESIFRRRSRMGQSLFLCIVNEVRRHDNYFVQQRDGLGRLRLSSLQKIIVVFQMLAYGVLTDSTDEYIKIEESIAIESMKRFCRAVMKVFGEHYLRSPNADDIARLLQIAHYVIQGKEYNTGYYLADGIYPKWSTLVQTIHDPRGPKKNLSTMKQEACRKDVERPAHFWNKHVLHDIMSACIIMHNMIIEDEHDVHVGNDNSRKVLAPEVEMAADENTRFQQFITRYRQIRDKEAHIALRNALIEHLWEQ